MTPRPIRGGLDLKEGSHRDSGLGAAGKARQRARNKATTTDSGSSGAAKLVSNMPMVDFDRVLAEGVYLTDIAGKISHTQMGSGGWLSVTLNVPLVYTHNIADVYLKSQQGMVYMQVYYVPMPTDPTEEATNGELPTT